MKKLLNLFLLYFVVQTSYGQILNPVQWAFSAESIKGSKSKVKLIIKATIERGWHVYSQHIKEGGPIPTSFQFIPSTDYLLLGKVKESPKPTVAYDKNFNLQISWHENEVFFTQSIELKKEKTTIQGSLEFMVCNDKQCLPPEQVTFSIPIFSKTSTNTTTSITSSTNDSLQSIKAKESKETLKGVNIASPTFHTSQAPSYSLWGIFVAGFLGGLAAFFMPCIYPMIPLTISFFTKREGSRNKGIGSAILYGLSIVIIYVLLGFFITLIFGASALNEAASSATFNLLFFIILILFALSFLGAFEITLPSTIVNKMDEKSDSKGFIGLFFMAFTLALVSFSCTGPIIGTLLVDAVSKGTYWGPMTGMLGFSSALAIPFVLFAIFPSWLKELPQSAGWLNNLKVSLGFLELALAFKFLSNVDLAYHLGIFNRDIFLIIWIIIFTLLSLYLLGIIRLKHDVVIPYLSLPRMFFAMLVLGFIIYMIPGLWGAPLKSISAWLPPTSTQDFDLYSNHTSISAPLSREEKKYANLFHAPHGLNAYYDYEQGLAYAKQVNKPILLDFTGWSCTNCRKMETSVWSNPQVLRRLQEDYVLISLYVDDKTELADTTKYISSFSNKKIKTIGQKWSDLQASRFGTNSQPYYIITNHNGQTLITPQAFDLDPNNYIQFLDKGKWAFYNK